MPTVKDIIMENLAIKTELGTFNFKPKKRLKLQQRKLVKRTLKKAAADLESEDIMSFQEIERHLKKLDSRIGTFGGTVVAYRTRLDMTQKQLAQKSGIDQAHISAMENNKRSIGVTTAKKLAKALKIDYKKLL